MDEKKPIRSEQVSPNIRMVYGDVSGNATVVDMRKLSKDERKKYRDAPRYKDYLELMEKRQQEVEQAALNATAKESPSEKTEPTSVKPAEPSPEAASAK